MGLLKKILHKEKQKPLENILQKEETYTKKVLGKGGKEYYYSEEAKIKGKEVYNLQKEYIKENTNDYLMQGAKIHKVLWHCVKELPKSEQKILELTGKGKCYETHKEYEKAITYYKKAEAQTFQVCGGEIQDMINEYGPGDYLYLSPIRQRIRVCEKKL